MKKVSPIGLRKTEHVQISLHEDVRSLKGNGLEHYEFIHEALPEINLPGNISTALFKKTLDLPILISSMTGGTKESYRINSHLSEAAEETGVALGVGSQRIALDEPGRSDSFSVTRKKAPSILLFANIGAIQLNNNYGISHCQKAVDMIGADALILHLNPLQEALQETGNTNFAELSNKIEFICRRLNVPVIVKEVGWGISRRAAYLLNNCGVSAIDVAGAGGTSWARVEAYRAPNGYYQKLAEPFFDWGIPTAESIINIKQSVQKMKIFASGGLRSGLDIAKCIGLGATIGGMAKPFLGAALVSTQEVIDVIRLLAHQIKISMLCCGASSLEDLERKLVNIHERG